LTAHEIDEIASKYTVA